MKSFSTWLERVGVILLAGMTLASIANAQQFTAGQKAKVKGQIVSRDGDLVKIQMVRLVRSRWWRSQTILRSNAKRAR